MTTLSERASSKRAVRNACLLSSAQIRRRRSRAVQILVAIASVLLSTELLVYLAREWVQDEWRSWVVQLVFPSHDVTSCKVLCLVGGFVLTFYHLIWAESRKQTSTRPPTTAREKRDVPMSSSRSKAHSNPEFVQSHRPNQLPPSLSEARTAAPTAPDTQEIPRGPVALQHPIEHELPQIKLVNEYQSPGISSSDASSSQVGYVNGKEPIAFENDFFQGHLLFLVRDSTLRKAANAKSNWSHLFNGRKRALWVQVQGRFKRLPPRNATLFLAIEVGSRLTLGFWTRKLIEVLVSLMKKLAKHVHVSFGDELSPNGDQATEEEAELPHAAFPLYQTVDEFVETPIVDDESSPATRLPPMLGIENFGESQQQKERRMKPPASEEKKVFALDKVYSFQFYTMYADLAQWQIANLPGMPEIPLKKLTGDQSIRFAAYFVTPPPLLNDGAVDTPATASVAFSTGGATGGLQLRHTQATKDYLFCFSLQYNEANRRSSGALSYASRAATNTGTLDRSTMLCSPTASSFRSSLQQQQLPVSTPPAHEELHDTREHSAAVIAQPESIDMPMLSPKLQAHERALRNLRFALPMWIEQVDRVAGNRKVSYLFTVEERVATPDDPLARPHRYSVVRSAVTIKNTLLMLRDDDSYETEGLVAATTTSSKQRKRSHEYEFRKLLVESREFLYETITSETEVLGTALLKIANEASSSTATPTRLEKLKRAMLSHCLKSSGTLPSVRAFQDIGIQLNKVKRERMDIIWECGMYRAHAPRLLRQEWLLLTTSDVLCFRSYSMRACKSIAISELLRVHAVDTPHVLNPQAAAVDATDSGAESSNGGCTWHCVELHLVCEIVTLFLDSEDVKKQFIASLNQMMRLIAKPGRLPSPRVFESQALPLCLNQRNLISSLEALGFDDEASSSRSLDKPSPLALVQDALRKGLTIYELPVSERKSRDLLLFLDAVELLSDMELPQDDDDILVSGLHGPLTDPFATTTAAVPPLTHEEKLAFALNLYHVLYIHATLVFGVPSSHFQWKKLQSVPFYIIGKRQQMLHSHKFQVRLTLEVIEHEMLRAGGSNVSSESSARKLLLLGSGKSSSNLGETSVVPRQLATMRSDFRTAFALQLNCRPGTHVIRIYDGSERIHEQLNATCSLFLAHELRVDLLERVIWLPRVIAWRQQDFLPRSGTSVAMSSGGGSGSSGDPRAFYCLQKLLGFLEDSQRDAVENVLMGADKSARIVYNTFWTERCSSRSSGDGGLLKRNGSDADRASANGDCSKSNADATAASLSATNGSGARQFFQSFF